MVIQPINREGMNDLLPLLEQRIKARIQQVRNNIHPAHNPIYIETLNIEIETLNLAQRNYFIEKFFSIKRVSTVRNPFVSEEIFYPEILQRRSLSLS